MEIKEIDFKLILDKPDNKIFRFSNEDDTAYDMTGSTVECKFYVDPGTPTEITCTLDIPNGKVIIPFTAVHVDTIGIFEYLLEETKTGGEVITLIRGNITVVQYIPFSETIEAYLRSELPSNITLSEDYRNQRIFYWRRILQEAFNISDEDINIEEKWPTLVNALLAKLIVYDALMLAAKGSLMGFFGGDYTSSEDLGGAISSITTGPTKVEFHSVADGLGSLFKANADGKTPLDLLTQDLCGLAGYLKVKLHMCQGNNIPIPPQYFKNPKWTYKSLTDLQ